MFMLQASQYVSDFLQTTQIKCKNSFFIWHCETNKPPVICYFYLFIQETRYPLCICQALLFKNKNKQLTLQSRTRYSKLSFHTFPGKSNPWPWRCCCHALLFELLQISSAELHEQSHFSNVWCTITTSYKQNHAATGEKSPNIHYCSSMYALKYKEFYNVTKYF